MIDRSMADAELEQIEIEAEGYELENYPISGVQLMAIITRLRMAEESAKSALPYFHMHANRARAARINSAWAFPRLGVVLFSICAGMTGAWVGGTALKARAEIVQNPDIIVVSFIMLSFFIPMLATMIPLLAWIDRLSKRRVDAGVYDAED